MQQLSEMLAAEAGLEYVGDGDPGYQRVRRGRGFSYLSPSGVAINGPARARLEALAIPPAWDRVWISSTNRAHILATGFDEAGRKQYIYHPQWEEQRDARKFEQLALFGRQLLRVRKVVRGDLGPDVPHFRGVAALAVAVLDSTLMRVGNAEYAESNDSYGLTTLTPEHVRVTGSRIQFEFIGKGGAEHVITLDDPILSRGIAKCVRLGGDTVLSYPAGDQIRSLTSEDINDYMRERLRVPVTAKVFRTWGATATVADRLGRTSPDSELDRSYLEAVDEAAARLGNTRDVCRSAYVHPAIADAYRAGTLREAWRASRTGRWMNRAEATVNRILADAM